MKSHDPNTQMKNNVVILQECADNNNRLNKLMPAIFGILGVIIGLLGSYLVMKKMFYEQQKYDILSEIRSLKTEMELACRDIYNIEAAMFANEKGMPYSFISSDLLRQYYYDRLLLQKQVYYDRVAKLNTYIGRFYLIFYKIHILFPNFPRDKLLEYYEMILQMPIPSPQPSDTVNIHEWLSHQEMKMNEYMKYTFRPKMNEMANLVAQELNFPIIHFELSTKEILSDTSQINK